MLEVIDASGLATIQDAGRSGWRRFGVPAAGPMDRFAFEAANLLAGNRPDAAAIEVGGGEMVLRTRYDCVLAVTGPGYKLEVNDWGFGLWGSYFVRGGWSVRLSRAGFGMWAYVAIAGGFDVEPVLGSRATYLRGRFGGLAGRSLHTGDKLMSASPPRSLMETAGRTIDSRRIPPYGASPIIDVIPGPQHEQFSNEDMTAFTSDMYRLSASSDRMGYRLEGAALRGGDVISQGMSAGCVQVPTGGQPIVMMADCATTGGYSVIGCVTSASMPLLAQCTPGQDQVRFRQTSVEDAQEAYRSMMAGLRHGIVEAEE